MTVAVRDLSYAYGMGTPAIRNLSLAIAEGELLAVIGPSGCGKSTLLKLIAGFLTPDRGDVLIGGVVMGNTAPRARDLGVVFQSYALFPHMTVAENIAYPLVLRRRSQAEIAQRVGDALAMIGLTGLADRRPAALSGGQQQRVALARALVFRPRALLLDEPLSALDAERRGEMRDEIRRLQTLHGIATLHITHDQEEALSIADRVAVMRDGAVLQVDTPANLYRRPMSRAVAAFVGHANLIDGVADEAGRVATAFGALAVPDPSAARPGQKVTLVVRPEDIEPAQEGSENVVLGTIARQRFLGATRRYDLITAVGTSLSITFDHRAEPSPRVVIPPAAIHVIPAGPESAVQGAAPSQAATVPPPSP